MRICTHSHSLTHSSLPPPSPPQVRVKSRIKEAMQDLAKGKEAASKLLKVHVALGSECKTQEAHTDKFRNTILRDKASFLLPSADRASAQAGVDVLVQVRSLFSPPLPLTLPPLSAFSLTHIPTPNPYSDPTHPYPTRP